MTIVCPEFDLAGILAEFPFGEAQALRKAQGGKVNENWIVKTPEAEIVVRCVAKERSLNDILFEHSIIDFLDRSGLPYRFPRPLISKSGETIIVKNGLFIWLYEYIGGHSSLRYSRELIEQIATAMASVHQATKRFSNPHLKRNPLVLEDPWLLKTMKSWQAKLRYSSDERCRYFCEHVDECLSILARLRSSPYRALPRFSIHGDWCMANVVFAGNSLAGIIDFDHCCFDTGIRDITVLLLYECVEPREAPKLDLAAAQHFIKCYNRVNPLSRAETNLIPTLAVAECADAFWWKMYEIAHHRGGTTTLRKIKNLFRALRWYSRNDRSIAHALRVT
jgi:homoserine kinase type II